MRSEACRVVVKCRATRADEAEGLGDGIHVPAPGRITLGKDFEADRVYLSSDGDAVYEDEVQALVASLYDGINSTVFAYGASGSGKTHTVLGGKQSPGLVDRITDEVFGSRYDQRTCTVSMSVEELYCERFTDLLAASAHPPNSSSSSSSSIASHHGGARSVHFRPPVHHRHVSAPTKYNWQKVTLTNSTEMKALVQHVLRKRHTASTTLNEKSSRSHVIVTITLEQRKAIIEHTYAEGEEPPCSSASSVTSAAASSSIGGSLSDLSSLKHTDSIETRSVQDDTASEAGSAAPVDTYLIGKLYLVDLAGSENIKRSGAEGARQKEAGEINKSLCHLKTVIEEVFSRRRVTTYRNSKLTFRLQDALGGGNSKLLVVACISTAYNDLQETKETLRFAEMARAITNTPMVNREPKDELIHRLQEQVAELQDQLKTARKEGGRSATEEVLAQLNATEAALADLKEETEAKEAKWTRMGLEAKQKVHSLSDVLSETQQRESRLQQQLAEERAVVQLLKQQLAAEQSARQGSQQASSAAADLLLDVQQDVSVLQQHCIALQQKVVKQQVWAATATRLCAEQQQQAQKLQQQLSAQAQELELLREQLQQEHNTSLAAEAQVSNLQQQQAELKQSAQQCSIESSQSMQQLSLLCNTLQEQVSAAVSQRDQALQQHQAVLKKLQASGAAQAAAKQELLKARQEIKQQQQYCADLQQELQRQAQSHAHELRQQSEQHAAEQNAAAAAAAKVAAQAAEAAAATAAEAAAQAAKELQQQRQAFEQQLQSAQQRMAGLQKELEDEKTEHEAMMAAEQLKHSQQLAESMHSSVKKLTADKLRCREHLLDHMRSLKVETESISQALASPNPCADLPQSRPGSPADGKSVCSSSPAAGLVLVQQQAQDAQDLQDQDLVPTGLQPQKRVSPVPPLQLDASEAMLSDTTAAPMQDASERNLSGGETSSEGYSSASTSAASTPGVAPMSAVAQQAAVMAVAAAAAAGVAKRLTPRRGYVHVHAEASSHGGHSDSILSRVDSMCVSEGRDSPADRMMLPSCGSLSGSPAPSSIDGSQHSSIHAAAASAAAAAVLPMAVRARSSADVTPEQKQRHHRRKRALPKSTTTIFWPNIYEPEEEIDMVAAAAAFSQMSRGAKLDVKSLLAYLAPKMLGHVMHTPKLPDGTRKRKRELVQDMLCYHKHWMATSVDRSNPSSRYSSSNGGEAVSAEASAGSVAAPSATPRSSMCSSPESMVWHPLGMARPGSAAPTSATSSPARAEFVRYSHDTSAGGARSSGEGGRAGQVDSQLQGRAAFAVEAADANSSRQQPDAGAPTEQQQSPGWWSKLTPRRSKKAGSILAQLQSGDKSGSRRLANQQVEDSWSPDPQGVKIGAHCSMQMSQHQQQRSNSRYESQGGCDAVSPRDKKHSAAASRAGSVSAPNSTLSPPGALSLSNRTISAVTGEVSVAQYTVDSPAVKLTQGYSKQHGGGGGNPMRQGVNLGAASVLRTSWKQKQLLRPR